MMKDAPLLFHFNIPGLTETGQVTVTYSWIAMGVLIVLAVIARTRLTAGAPTGIQNFFEVVVKGFEDFIEDMMGPEGKHYFTLIAGMFIYILVCNLMGLIPGFDAPTANLNTTLALALVSFFVTHYIGLKRYGPCYIKHFFGPMWILAPFMFIIEVISHLARIVSLSVRLFGNMIAKHKLLLVLALLAPYIVPVPILALGLLVSVVQAGVFTLLMMMYFSGSIEEAHIGGGEHH